MIISQEAVSFGLNGTYSVPSAKSGSFAQFTASSRASSSRKSRTKLDISQPWDSVLLENSRSLYGVLFDKLLHFSRFSFSLVSHSMETKVQHPLYLITHGSLLQPRRAPGLIALLLSSYGNLVNTCITELIFHNPFQKAQLVLSEFCQDENSFLSTSQIHHTWPRARPLLSA